ncbi:MAG: hypothetical protein KDK99_21695 [Verrucomicrobiales bacterium]|nr:hypothetical protein [Verrucomicrobiales bacterium]
MSAAPHPDSAALQALQQDLYQEELRRARAMTEEQRLQEVFELSNHQFGMMLAGAMHRIGTTDEDEGWREVRRWMHRLNRTHDHGFYSTQRPSAS